MPTHFKPDDANSLRLRAWVRDRRSVPEPGWADVLSALMNDAVRSDQYFEDWCSDMAYDPDSRKALDLYLTCQHTAIMLRRLFGAHRERLEEALREY